MTTLTIKTTLTCALLGLSMLCAPLARAGIDGSSAKIQMAIASNSPRARNNQVNSTGTRKWRTRFFKSGWKNAGRNFSGNKTWLFYSMTIGGLRLAIECASH